MKYTIVVCMNSRLTSLNEQRTEMSEIKLCYLASLLS